VSAGQTGSDGHDPPAARVIQQEEHDENVTPEETSMAKDPVCGMQVDEKAAAGKSEYKAQTYYFCSPACKAKFDQDPATYTGAR